MTSAGVVYVAYGERARQSAVTSIAMLRKHNTIPIATISDEPILDVKHIHFGPIDTQARWAKLNIDKLVEWSTVVYLDADTRVNGSLSPLTGIAEDFDLVIAFSENQGNEIMNHIGSEERLQTIMDIGNPAPLQLQGGVMIFNRLRCQRFFEVWREEWQRWKDQDQAALLRALYREPLRIWLVGRPWNGGEIIKHLFGMAR